MDCYYDDFTEENYRRLLIIAKESYLIRSFEDSNGQGKNMIIRHDIDFSLHRALKLAEIEAEEGIRATYFLHLHNEFYNLLDDENTQIVNKIIALKHKIGLHFDYSYFQPAIKARSDLYRYLIFEKKVLEEYFGVNITAFSFHNPTTELLATNKDYEMAGMINVYSKYFFDNYAYCSDSNGYWRYERLEDILVKACPDKLQILIHPAWWTPEAMSPRDRITQCIEGRAKKQHSNYDALLERMGSKNVR